jgi:ABC-type multidrug transport system fused ATPase/permease subunit
VAAERETLAHRFVRPVPMLWHKEIRLEKVSFAYPRAKRPVIEGMDLVIPKNSSLGIVGETGSGKSTLVDLVLGLHVPTAGRIMVDDTPLAAGNRRAWRAGIGYVPQDIFLIDESIAANIAFGIPPQEVDPAAVLAAAEAAQIREFVERELPQGFDTVVGERGVRLSGGQRQRIGLARALYHKPELLILDEATSALDIETEAEVMKAIRNLQGSVTMLIIAHRLSTIQDCDVRVDLSERLLSDGETRSLSGVLRGQ